MKNTLLPRVAVICAMALVVISCQLPFYKKSISAAKPTAAPAVTCPPSQNLDEEITTTFINPSNHPTITGSVIDGQGNETQIFTLAAGENTEQQGNIHTSWCIRDAISNQILLSFIASSDQQVVSATGQISQAAATQIPSQPAAFDPTITTQPGKFLFQDNFISAEQSNWTGLEMDGAKYAISAGSYNITAANNSDARSFPAPALNLGDVQIDVDVAAIDFSDRTSAGVLCRVQDENNYYFLGIGPDGSYGIQLVKDSTYIWLERRFEQTSSIIQGNKLNHITASCAGNVFTLAVNGQTLIQTIDQSFNRGSIGLEAKTGEAGGAEIQFKQLTVQEADSALAEEPVLEKAPLTGQKLFKDDFSDPNSGWGTEKVDNHEMLYSDGKYKMIMLAKETFVYANPNNQDYRDIEVNVDAEPQGSFNDNYYGVICRIQDNDNFYMASVSGDGFIEIDKYSGGNFSVLGITYRAGEDFSNGKTQLVVSCVGDAISVYANGLLMQRVNDSTFNKGQVGLTVGAYNNPPATVLFDNFVLYAPK
jgi:hypothetical protein